MRRVHRWIALTASLFLLSWLTSGIVMLAPGLLRGASINRQAGQAALNIADLRISAADALVSLERELGRAIHVVEVVVRPFRGNAVYEIRLADGHRRLVDAKSGEVVTITPELVETIARESAPRSAGVLETSLLDRRDYYYWGPTPVYRIRFDDPARTVVYVAQHTGQVQRMNRLGRIRAVIAGLHEMEPLRLITENSRARNTILVVFAVVGIATLVTGYALALPALFRGVFRRTTRS